MPLPTCSKCRFKGVGHSDASGKFCCEWCWAGLEGRRWPTLGGHSPQFKALTAALRPSSFAEDDRENKVALVDVGMEADAECAELAGEYVCASLAAVTTDFLSDHNTPPRCAIWPFWNCSTGQACAPRNWYRCRAGRW